MTCDTLVRVPNLTSPRDIGLSIDLSNVMHLPKKNKNDGKIRRLKRYQIFYCMRLIRSVEKFLPSFSYVPSFSSSLKSDCTYFIAQLLKKKKNNLHRKLFLRIEMRRSKLQSLLHWWCYGHHRADDIVIFKVQIRYNRTQYHEI